MNNKLSQISHVVVYWIIGLAPAFPIVVAARLFKNITKPYPATTLYALCSISLAVYITTYLASILINTWGDFDSRAIAALYNLSLLITGYLIFTGTRTYFIRSWQEAPGNLSRHALILLVQLYILAAAAFVAFGYSSEVKFPSLIGNIIPLEHLPPLAKDSMSMYVFLSDWVGDVIIGRLSIVSPYANALAGMVVLLMGLCFRLRTRTIVVLSITSLLLIYLTRSRIGIASLIFTLMFFYAGLALHRLKTLYMPALILAAVVVSSFIYIMHNSGSSASISRDSSDRLRNEVYAASIEAALNHNPIIGMGVKQRTDTMAIPLGSHSTYVGAFYKTGILGSTCLIVFIAGLIIQCVKVIRLGVKYDIRLTLPAASLLSMCLFLMFEDLDAPQFMLTLFFITSGLVFSIGTKQIRQHSFPLANLNA